jgi:hypothetical protein
LPDKIEPNQKAVADFITRWEASGSAERANYTMFLTELFALLGVPGPEPTRPDDRDNAYVFERAVPSRREAVMEWLCSGVVVYGAVVCVPHYSTTPLRDYFTR